MESSMYPRFKVREQGQEQEQEDEPSPRVTETPFVRVCCSPAKENRFDSPQSILRTPPPAPSVPNSTGKSISECKDSTGTKNRHVGEENKISIKAGSVLRPRAVLSSPDNDRIMGKRNKIDNHRSPALKNSDAGMNSPAGTKFLPNREKAETPVVVKKDSKVAPSSAGAGKQRKLSRSDREKAGTRLNINRQFKVASNSKSTASAENPKLIKKNL